MAKATFTLTGDKELERQLRRLNAAVDGPELASVLKPCGQLIVDAARPLAPVETGALRDSIQVAEVDTGAHVADVTVVADVDYSARIEFGFFGPDSLGRVYHQPAQPYLRPAIAATRRMVKHTITVGLRAKLRRAAA